MSELHEKLLKEGFYYFGINHLTNNKIFQDVGGNQIEIIHETYPEGKE